MTAWRYARVSTADQHLDAQVDALRAAGVDEAHLVTEHASGARARQADADALTDTAGGPARQARGAVSRRRYGTRVCGGCMVGRPP